MTVRRPVPPRGESVPAARRPRLSTADDLAVEPNPCFHGPPGGAQAPPGGFGDGETPADVKTIRALATSSLGTPSATGRLASSVSSSRGNDFSAGQQRGALLDRHGSAAVE